jgi:hypothetical protein
MNALKNIHLSPPLRAVAPMCLRASLPLACAFALVTGVAVAANAQDSRKQEDWKKMYQDASAQLRAAQNRKADLAAENAELEKKLAAAQGEIDSLQSETDSSDERSFMLRAFYSAWEAFIRQNPAIGERWRVFWNHSLPGLPDDKPVLYDPQWSLTDYAVP